MSLTVDAWNQMMSTFLEELCTTLDDVPSVHAARSAFNLALMSDKSMVMKAYMEMLEPMAQRVLAKDETLVEEGTLGQLDVFKDCDFKKVWYEELDESTKGAIWNYLSTLYSIGKACEVIPGEMMGGIEKLARECGDKMKSGEMGLGDLNPAMIGAKLAAELGEESEMGKSLAEAARALQDPNSEESKQAAMLQTMLMMPK